MKWLPEDRRLPLGERRALGRARRRVLPRVEQAIFRPPAGRGDPVEVILRANARRLPHLLPIKYGRMAASPLAFFRGAAPVMARDIGRAPVTGLIVQLCGDAHVRNLGAYAAPDGHLVFDVNDFDETVAGPWEWDLKRLAASFVLAGREAGDSDRVCAGAVEVLARAWREGLERLSWIPVLELARYQVRRYLEKGPVHDVLRKAQRATPLQTLAKLTRKGRGGACRFRSRPPVLFPPGRSATRAVLASLASYRENLDADRRLVLQAYRPADVAFKVVGTGSVGTRDYVVLLFGNGPRDPLFLQIKEELPSCWASFLPTPREAHEGRRVAEGQHRLQTLTDPLLGWTTIAGRPYLVRQLADHKASVNPEDLGGKALLEYALVCGETFAKAHARTGDPAALSGYAGRTSRLDRALARFALAYADETERDFSLFVKAIRRGRVPALRGV